VSIPRQKEIAPTTNIILLTVEREPLNFGSIAARVKGVEEAFHDINKAMFPDSAHLPSVPDTLFHAEMLSTAAANDTPLRVLSLGASLCIKLGNLIF
jgi:hypothetical protein